MAGETLSAGPLNLSPRFGGRTQLFWRVGARSTTDEQDPVNAFVFSFPRSFMPAPGT
jgi:hypothetical protein